MGLLVWGISPSLDANLQRTAQHRKKWTHVPRTQSRPTASIAGRRLVTNDGRTSAFIREICSLRWEMQFSVN